jgi:argininosuccinate synthase
LILEALRQLEALTLDRETAHFKESLALKYAELVYSGLWFTPLRESLDAFFASVEANVTGSIKLSLYKGNLSFISRKSDFSLYSADLSSFTMGESYDQKDAAGFIKILGLPARVRAQVMGKQKVAAK